MFNVVFPKNMSGIKNILNVNNQFKNLNLKPKTLKSKPSNSNMEL
jgi:hypothetical protein